jgi:hypothetical protein
MKLGELTYIMKVYMYIFCNFFDTYKYNFFYYRKDMHLKAKLNFPFPCFFSSSIL